MVQAFECGAGAFLFLLGDIEIAALLYRIGEIVKLDCGPRSVPKGVVELQRALEILLRLAEFAFSARHEPQIAKRTGDAALASKGLFSGEGLLQEFLRRGVVFALPRRIAEIGKINRLA